MIRKPYEGGRRVSAAEVALAFGEAPDGRMVSIADVPSGRACGMVCPGCRAALWAKKGAINAHHFAHAADGTCSAAYETMMHKLAKQIISDEMRIYLPRLAAHAEGLSKEVYPATWFVFDRVELEVWQDGIRPDIVGHRGARSLAVEVLVTHACGPEKIALIRERQTAMIEIDLSGVARDSDLTLLTAAVLRDAPRRWLFNSKLAAAENELLWEAIAQRVAAERAAAEAARVQAAAEQAARIAKARADAERREAEKIWAETRRKAEAEQERVWAEQSRIAREADAKRRQERNEAAARAAEQQAVEVARIKEDLLRYATGTLGPERTRTFMASHTREGWSPEAMTHPEQGQQAWTALRRAVAAMDAAEARNAAIRDELGRDASLHFRSPDRAAVWLRSKHPRLNMLSPFDACLASDGLRRCMAMLK